MFFSQTGGYSFTKEPNFCYMHFHTLLAHRFTQFKKFNLERHMRNKHPQLYGLSEPTRKMILDRYVSRYEGRVTPGMVAAVPAHGNEHMASEIMAVGPIQLDDLGDIQLQQQQQPQPQQQQQQQQQVQQQQPGMETAAVVAEEEEGEDGGARTPLDGIVSFASLKRENTVHTCFTNRSRESCSPPF